MIYRPQSQLARLRSERYGDNAKAKVPMSFSYHGPRRTESERGFVFAAGYQRVGVAECLTRLS